MFIFLKTYFWHFQLLVTKIEYMSAFNVTETFDLSFKQLEDPTIFGLSLTGFEVSMTRIPTPFFINTYVPSGLLTVIAFIGFVIPVAQVKVAFILLGRFVVRFRTSESQGAALCCLTRGFKHW